MSYIYPQAVSLVGQSCKGNHQCVWLIQNLAGAPHTRQWREGDPVKGQLTLAVGTAIATFFDGRYPSRPHGNHAAFYVGQDATGTYVVDQWLAPGKTQITRRHLPFAMTGAALPAMEPIRIGDSYSVIE